MAFPLTALRGEGKAVNSFLAPSKPISTCAMGRGTVRLAPSSHGKVRTTIRTPAAVAGQLSAPPAALSATFLSTRATGQGLSLNATDSFGSPPRALKALQLLYTRPPINPGDPTLVPVRTVSPRGGTNPVLSQASGCHRGRKRPAPIHPPRRTRPARRVSTLLSPAPAGLPIALKAASSLRLPLLSRI